MTEKKKTTLDDLIELSTNEQIKELARGLTPEELDELIKNADKEASDYRFLAKRIEDIKTLCVLNNDEKLSSGDVLVDEVYQVIYQVNTELRKMYPDSYFLHQVFDDAIIGVDPKTKSIIYGAMNLGYLKILSSEGIYADLDDRCDGAHYMIHYVNNLTENQMQGKVPPIIILGKAYQEHWYHIINYPD